MQAALQKKKTLKYLTRMIRNYLRDRQIIYEDDDCSIEEEMTCKAPQGSRIGPYLWNTLYEDFSEMKLPGKVTLIGFADDAIIICPENNLELLEMKVNESLRRVKIWLESRKLQMALEKTEILLVTDKGLLITLSLKLTTR